MNQNEWNEIFAEEYKQLTGRDVEQDEEQPIFSGKLEVVEDWPIKDPKLGEIGGLATDNEGHVYVFHRADRTWEAR